MSEYYSILKEKKKKKEPPKDEPKKVKKKHFPYLILIIISFIVLLVVNYFIYYNTILKAENIVFSNLSRVIERYKGITDNLLLDKLFVNNIEGSILIDNTYTYNFIKEEKNYYMQTPGLSINTYVSDSINKNLKIDLDLSSVSEEKYIKKFYFDDKRPIVEVVFMLDKLELEKVLKTTLKDDYEVTITSRNDAFNNSILNMKIVINNKSNGDRKAITFDNNNIVINTSNSDYEFKININGDIFNVKIYKDKELYSVLSGTPTLNTYKYTYQIIDELYTINLITSKKDDKYKYELSSNINNVSSNLVLSVSSMSNVSNKLIATIDNNNLTELDKNNYNNDMNFLKEFIDKY